MLFDATNFTLTLDLKDCIRCFGRGTVPTKIACPLCNGSGNGVRGGKGKCKSCHGSGNGYDHDNPSTCEICKGSPKRASQETWTDKAPDEAVAALQLRVARQDRETSWNESYLGLGCLWSSTDYGDAWNADDITVLSKVRADLLKDRTQACKLLAVEYDSNAKTLPIVRGLVIVVSNNGYSVRADTTLAESNAEREPGYAAAHIIGMAVYHAGGNGTMAAAMPLPKED